jgi:addiction module RelE/StbE family toxin
MAEGFEIVWSPQAESDLQDILTYWINNNQSFLFAEKLYDEISEAISLLRDHPLTGKLIEIQDFRRLVIRFYLVIYRVSGSQIRILRIWDGRQNELFI